MGRISWGAARALMAVALLTPTAGAQGIVAPDAGPINRSMAGASTAAAVDLGASYWNPATLNFLERDEVLVGTELIIPSIHYSAASSRPRPDTARCGATAASPRTRPSASLTSCNRTRR